MRTKVTLLLIAGLLVGNGAVKAVEPAPLARKDGQPSSTAAQDNVIVTIAPGAKLKILPLVTEKDKKIKLEMPGVTIEAGRLSVKTEGATFEMRVCADGGIQMRRLQDENRAAKPSKPPLPTSPAGVVPVPAAVSAVPERPMPSPSCGLFGNRLENFSLRDLEDKVWQYKRDRRGRLTLLSFWYHNCGPCLQSIPHLVGLQRDFGPYGLEVVGIACETGTTEEQRQQVRAVRGRYGINYRTLLCGGSAGDCPVMEQFQVDYFPLLVLIDEDGTILWRSTREGMDDREYHKLDKRISDRLLNKGL